MKTVKSMIEHIKKLEQGHTYQIYVVKEQTKDTKKYYDYNPIVNGQKCYKVYYQLVYAKNFEKEQDQTVLKYDVDVEEHVNISLSGKSWTGHHNIYRLYVDKISKGNKGTTHTIYTKEVAYKPEELKNRRFYL